MSKTEYTFYGVCILIGVITITLGIWARWQFRRQNAEWRDAGYQYVVRTLAATKNPIERKAEEDRLWNEAAMASDIHGEADEFDRGMIAALRDSGSPA